MNVIDLFAGCGGLSLGFLQAGFSVHKAVEIDPVIANTYQQNHPEIEVIVDDIQNIDIAGTFQKGEAEIIIGGPPCQGFSMAGARIRQGFKDDPRNYLFQHYYNVVNKVKPKVFVIENVKGMKNMQGGKIFADLLKIFSDQKINSGKPYYIFANVIKAVDFGIPQKRERLIIVGTTIADVWFEKLWLDTQAEIMEEYPDYFSHISVRDAIGNLPAVTEDGMIDNPVPCTPYQKYLSCEKEKLTNHTQSKHSKKAIERMKKISNGQNYTELDERINSVHSGAYGRLCWEEPAATITTRFDTPAGGRFIHPAADRTLSPREAARIQSFPDDFVFYGSRREISRQIGNAVPPKISFFLARFVLKILEQEK